MHCIVSHFDMLGLHRPVEVYILTEMYYAAFNKFHFVKAENIFSTITLVCWGIR